MDFARPPWRLPETSGALDLTTLPVAAAPIGVVKALLEKVISMLMVIDPLCVPQTPALIS